MDERFLRTEMLLGRQAMERLGQWKHFSFVLSSSQYGPKTRPDIYREAARRLGAQPRDIVVFEDALHAARTAKQAGFLVAGFFAAGFLAAVFLAGVFLAGAFLAGSCFPSLSPSPVLAAFLG